MSDPDDSFLVALLVIATGACAIALTTISLRVPDIVRALNVLAGLK